MECKICRKEFVKVDKGMCPKCTTTTLQAENEKLKELLGIPINIIFDGPPSHESGRFIEVETDDGKSINAGEWIDRKDGTWALRITALPTDKENHGNEPSS